LVAWGIAFYYSRRANLEFDALSRSVVADMEKKFAQKAKA
jgi:uncharacterized membrane protein (DUF485 family)